MCSTGVVVLSVRSYGEGRPIVVLPWFSLDGGVTAAGFEPALAGISGWRRIYVDLPGTGNSAPVAPTSDAVLDAVDKTVQAVVETLPYLLVGCSYGGYLAAELARRHPAQVGGLLLVCAGVKIQPEERNLSRLVPSIPQPGWLDAVSAEWHDHFRHAIGAQTASVADRIHHAVSGNGANDEDYLAELRSVGYRLSDESAGRRFDGITTILAGTQDRVAGYLDLVDALATYPNGSYHALNTAGHYLPFEQPERFSVIVRDWLARAAGI